MKWTDVSRCPNPNAAATPTPLVVGDTADNLNTPARMRYACARYCDAVHTQTTQ